jgi:tRNA dimethylallyltransferase
VAQIEARFEAMMRQDALAEVRALVAHQFSSELPIMRALGVKPLAACIAGQSPREAAVAAAKAETRQYAKRQLTWFRRHMIAWKWLDAQEIERSGAENISFIDH